MMPEHRGKRLGLALKASGLLRWHEFAPVAPAVHTRDAEGNRFMLDVHETVGFRPNPVSGAFTKELT